jgi:hypothetical protein
MNGFKICGEYLVVQWRGEPVCRMKVVELVDPFLRVASESV